MPEAERKREEEPDTEKHKVTGPLVPDCCRRKMMILKEDGLWVAWACALACAMRSPPLEMSGSELDRRSLAGAAQERKGVTARHMDMAGTTSRQHVLLPQQLNGTSTMMVV